MDGPTENEPHAYSFRETETSFKTQGKDALLHCIVTQNTDARSGDPWWANLRGCC
jgi:hypothetical protein